MRSPRQDRKRAKRSAKRNRQRFPPPYRKLPPLTRYWLGVCRKHGGAFGGYSSWVIFAPGPTRRVCRVQQARGFIYQ